MKTTMLNLARLLLLPAATLCFTSCSSTPDAEHSSVAYTQTGVPGSIVVDTYKVTAKVTDVDPATRRVTLETPSGKKTVFKAGPEILNFPQIRVGDLVKVTLTEELVVAMATGAASEAQGGSSTVALAPVGSKPGLISADTATIRARVIAIDHHAHKATLQFSDGSSKTIAVRKDVDLTKRSIGEEVVIRATETFAVSVEKP